MVDTVWLGPQGGSCLFNSFQIIFNLCQSVSCFNLLHVKSLLLASKILVLAARGRATMAPVPRLGKQTALQSVLRLNTRGPFGSVQSEINVNEHKLIYI